MVLFRILRLFLATLIVEIDNLPTDTVKRLKSALKSFLEVLSLLHC